MTPDKPIPEPVNVARAMRMQKIIDIDKGDFRAFVYEGDIAATPTPTWRMLPAEPLPAPAFVAAWRPAQDMLLLLTAWYLAENIPTIFLDIGSNIGTDAMRVAKLARLLERQLPIVAFEPGVNADLLPYTLKLNDLDEIVFEEMCVSNTDKPTILFGEFGTSVNNRIVNRLPESEGFCKIVHSTTLDAYLVRFPDHHPVIKIDTQGAEWLIWQGMKKAVATRQISMIMEFTPWALQPFVPPPKFLGDLTEHFHLFDLGHGRDRFLPVDDFNAFLQRVSQPPFWTDILCISRTLPSAGKLSDRIAAAYPPAHESPL